MIAETIGDDMITASVFGATVPACPTGQSYSRTLQRCTADTGGTSKPTCPAGQSLNTTTKTCEKTAPPKGTATVIGPDGLPLTCSPGQVYDSSVGCRTATDAEAAALAQTAADQAAVRAAIASGKPAPILNIIRIHNYVLTAAETTAFAKVIAKAKSHAMALVSASGTPGGYAPPTSPKYMLDARFKLYWPESGTTPIEVGKENTTDAHWIIERFENPNGRPFVRKFSDGATITFSDEKPPIWAKFWNPKTKMLQIGPQPKDNSTFFSGHVTKYGWGDFWDDLKAVVCPAGLIMSAIPVTTAAGVAITTGCAIAAAVEAATSSGDGAGTKTDPAKTEPVVTPKYPPGTVTAFDPSTNLWRIAIPRGTTLGDLGQEANTHVEAATSSTAPATVPQVTINNYNIMIGAASPWYKSWWFWGLVGVTTATVIGVVIYRRRRTTA